MNSFVTIQSSIDQVFILLDLILFVQSKGILWDISEEEEDCAITPTEDEDDFMDKNDDLELIINSTLAGNNAEEK